MPLMAQPRVAVDPIALKATSDPAKMRVETLGLQGTRS